MTTTAVPAPISPSNLQLTQIPTSRKGMLIRKPAPQVFQAFVDPAITTRFWFTRSSGKMTSGARLQWDWEMYGVSADVIVKEVVTNSLIVFEWGAPDNRTTVELRFIPWQDDSTYLQIAESGLRGTGDQIAAYAANSTGGFAFMLAAAKALLEHDVVLTLVLDYMPKGLQLTEAHAPVSRS